MGGATDRRGKLLSYLAVVGWLFRGLGGLFGGLGLFLSSRALGAYQIIVKNEFIAIGDQQIGTGTSFSRDVLTAGTHTITLTAKNSLGEEGIATITITVVKGNG